MSAIQKELLSATGLDAAKFGDDRAAMHAAIVKAVNTFTDKAWAALTIPAQDWFNEAADATKAKQPLKEFSDYKAAEPEGETRSRRRSAAADDEKPAKGGEPMAVEKLQEDDRVKITTKRGKVIEGVVVENSKRKEYVVIKNKDGEEDEVDYDKVNSVEVFHGTAGQAEEAGPEVGDEVTFMTKRGKKVSGLIMELTEDTIVLDGNDDYDLAKIDGDITITKKGSGSSKEEPAARGSRRSSAAKEEAGDDEKPTRSSNPRGVSVGGRIRELLADDPDLTEEAIGKVLKKEKIEFRDASLKMIYKDASNLIKLLRDAGQMKKAK